MSVLGEPEAAPDAVRPNGSQRLSVSAARFARLARAVRDLSAARTHADIIDITRKAARDLTGAMGIAIVLREGRTCHYIAEDSEVPLWSGQTFPIEACISGWAMLNRAQVVVPDIYQDGRIPHEAYRATGIHSLIMTPIGKPEPFAALGAYWIEVRQASADETGLLSALASCMATALENIDLVASLRAETDHQQLLINELNHRVKNTLAIIQGVAAQTLRAGRLPEVARADFEARLISLANAHALTTEAGWRSISLRKLIEQTVAPFAGEGRFELSGRDMALPPKSAVAFALAIHELCANAVKYGALSTPSGAISVTLQATDDRLHMTWRESGGPRLDTGPPGRRGFGFRLLERGLAAELGGAVRLAFQPDGLVCDVEAPAPRETAAALFPLPARGKPANMAARGELA